MHARLCILIGACTADTYSGTAICLCRYVSAEKAVTGAASVGDKPVYINACYL